MTTYIRTNNGKTIHLSACYVAQRAARKSDWVWAEGRPWMEVFNVAVLQGYNLCKKCIPL